MYIQNQSFKDEETLLEQLFDFDLGEPTAEVAAMIAQINTELINNQEFQAYRATISDEEEIMELDDDERRLGLAEKLMAVYDSFLVDKNQLFGVKDGQNILLYSLDLY
ncbi:MAG: hypothetical protein V4561_12115 [Bacteroidota bacterium]